MIDEVKEDESLTPHIKNRCSEKGVTIILSALTRERKCVIIDGDTYYGSLNLPSPPPTPDCIIIQQCEQKDDEPDTYKISFVELKSTNDLEKLKVSELKAKFSTGIDFLKKFPQYFSSVDYKISGIEFLLATNKRTPTSEKLKPLKEALITTTFQFQSNKNIINFFEPTDEIQPC
jgi:hypothetical protein